jgi:hypothetical protein
MARVRLNSQALSYSFSRPRQSGPSTIIGVRSYNVSRFSPIQPPPVTCPTSAYFVPRKMGQSCRLRAFYEEFVAPDFLLMSYNPTATRKTPRLPLRWDGTSPYHKNRPQPRETRPAKLVQPITAANIPEINSITVYFKTNKQNVRKPAPLLNGALVVQTLTGLRPVFLKSKMPRVRWKVRKGSSLSSKD